MRTLLVTGLLALLTAVVPSASALSVACEGEAAGTEMDSTCTASGLPAEPTTFTIDCWSHDYATHYEAGCNWSRVGPAGIIGTCVVQNKDGQYHHCNG